MAKTEKKQEAANADRKQQMKKDFNASLEKLYTPPSFVPSNPALTTQAAQEAQGKLNEASSRVQAPQGDPRNLQPRTQADRFAPVTANQVNGFSLARARNAIPTSSTEAMQTVTNNMPAIGLVGTTAAVAAGAPLVTTLAPIAIPYYLYQLGRQMYTPRLFTPYLLYEAGSALTNGGYIQEQSSNYQAGVAAAKNQAKIDYAVNNIDRIHRAERLKALTQINKRVKDQKLTLLTFYFGETAARNIIQNPNQLANTAFPNRAAAAPTELTNAENLKTAYGWNDQQAKEYIQKQLTTYDHQKEELVEKLDDFQREEKKTLQKDLEEEVKNASANEAKLRYNKMKNPNFKDPNQGVSIGTDSKKMKKIPDDSTAKFKKLGIEVTEGMDEHGNRTFTMKHEERLFGDGLFPSLFRASREAKVLNVIMDACFSDPDTKTITISGGSEEQRRTFWLQASLRAHREGRDITVQGYSPSAKDLKTLAAEKKAFDTQKQKSLKTATQEQASRVNENEVDLWIKKQESEDSGFETWFNQQGGGKPKFDQWKTAHPADSNRLSPAEQPEEWWNSTATASNNGASPREEFTDWEASTRAQRQANIM